jgi:hypothetical protein
LSAHADEGASFFVSLLKIRTAFPTSKERGLVSFEFDFEAGIFPVTA